MAWFVISCLMEERVHQRFFFLYFMGNVLIHLKIVHSITELISYCINKLAVVWCPTITVLSKMIIYINVFKHWWLFIIFSLILLF